MTFTDVHTDHQKFLESKVVQKLKFQKMTITKNLLLNWYSSMKKKIRKIQIIFDVENWLWKSDLGTFLTTHVNICESQIRKIRLFYWLFFSKIWPLLTHVLKTPLLRSRYCITYSTWKSAKKKLRKFQPPHSFKPFYLF